MATPKETIWELEEHTIAKHEILSNYLKAWFPIISRFNKAINYVDGFAGPGIYSKGEPGSPIIALNVATEHTSALTGDINFLFIEEDTERAKNLELEIQKLKLKTDFKVRVLKEKFHESIEKALKELENEEKILAPTFLFIDPFGFSGIPASLLAKLLNIPKVEVFINFAVDSINRFIGLDDTKEHISELFGTDAVIELIKSSSQDRVRDLKDLYQIMLQENAKFVRHFEMRNIENRIIYYLFFASNNSRGHLKMKEAMWRVNKEGDFTFSDSTNPLQEVLFAKNEFGEDVFSILREKFKNKTIDVLELKVYVENETAFLDKHLNQALRYAEQNLFISVKEYKKDGKKRRKGSFPEGTIIKVL
ncbi:MAG TPA: three-Cys-motif partner protein TcmP [Ignavibacteriaceae bacterium]|nr:three-Cys-motif partner protein TcmP [Ignavibacteriaceae bacterium]